MRKVLLVVSFASLFALSSTYAQTLASFETPALTPTVQGSMASVVSNPDKNGNSSDKAVYYKKDAGNWQAITLVFATMQNVGNKDVLAFKLRSSTVGRVYLKLFNDNVLVTEGWAPYYEFQPTANNWTSCSYNTSSVLNTNFNTLQVFASVDNEATADAYLDDFRLYNSASPNGEPIIKATVSTFITDLNTAVQFDASASTDEGGTIEKYTWDFGDGTTGSGATVSHSFTTDGVFTVSLTVEDNDGNKSYKQFDISVLPTGKNIGAPAFSNQAIKLYEKIEARFPVRSTYTNVYDPAVVQIDATITLPDLTTQHVPCFYFEKSKYNSLNDTWTSDGQGTWMVRFSASQVGEHSISLVLKDAGGTQTTTAVPVMAEDGPKKGIVKLDPDNAQFYRHTTGQPFYPLGINAAWATTGTYTTILKALAKGKANLVRYWQVPFDGQGLEWKDGQRFYKGLGVYSQEAAAEQDSMMSLCENLGLYMQITLFQHGMFSETVNSNWNDNPYSSANGGPLAKAEEYFYNDQAKAYTKKLLRYIVARWGYSSNLFAWELFNEVQFTGNFPYQTSQWSPAVNAWHDEMAQYLKTLDAFDHIVCTSAEDERLPALDAFESIDNVQYHLYSNNLLEDQIARDEKFTKELSSVVNGEYGTNDDATVSFDMQRHAIWNGIMTRVPHLMWRWEDYTSQTWADLFKYPAAFVAEEDFVAQGTLASYSIVAKDGTTTMGASGFHSSEYYYGYVYDKSNRNNLEGVVCDVMMPAGKYAVQFYNVITGATTQEELVVTSTRKLTLPKFNKSIAFKAQLTEPVVTSLENDPDQQVRVYPNPARGLLHIESDELIQSIVLRDVQGRVQYQTSPEQQKHALTISKFQQGLYLITIQTRSHTVVKKVVVE